MVLQPSNSVDFQLQLDNFEGPFDMLLKLIAKHELDVTDIALAQVTDEFLVFVKTIEKQKNLETASEFVVVAATLIDYKLASLLPRGQLIDAEDVKALQAKDLLFARLLQYKAFKEASAWLQMRLFDESRRFQRAATLEQKYKEIKPPLIFNTDIWQLAALAESLFSRDSAPGIEHLHRDRVSVKEQAEHIALKLRSGPKSFGELIVDLPNSVIVASFLAVLELYAQSAVTITQSAGESMLIELVQIPSLANQIGADYD